MRIATEIQLHRSIFKALDGDRNHYLRTRLWYLVYVCDHHFSVAYGRPPMTRQCDAIRACWKFLDTEHAVEDDHRLMCESFRTQMSCKSETWLTRISCTAQVQFWTVGGEIYETFGVDVDRPLDRLMLCQVGKLSADLDRVRETWYSRFKENRYVGNYPRKGVLLHCHFAKLYVDENQSLFRHVVYEMMLNPLLSMQVLVLDGISRD